MEHTFIALVRFNNKFTWALDKDILYKAIKISLLIAFWQYFADTIALRDSQNQNFVAPLHTYTKRYLLLKPHELLPFCLENITIHLLLSSDREFPFWELPSPSLNSVCWYLLELLCCNVVECGVQKGSGSLGTLDFLFGYVLSQIYAYSHSHTNFSEIFCILWIGLSRYCYLYYWSNEAPHRRAQNINFPKVWDGIDAIKRLIWVAKRSWCGTCLIEQVIPPRWFQTWSAQTYQMQPLHLTNI